MIVKNIVFMFVLLLVGCGVMNNPNPDKGVGDEQFTNITSRISRIDSDSLIVSEENRILVESIGNMSLQTLTSFKIFETSSDTEVFLSDLNSSSQTLASGDLATVEGWIKNIQDANTNYQTNNLLFYPIIQNKDCGLKESVSIKENNATIMIEDSRNACDMAFVYHILLYEVDKSIENISVNAFDIGTITVSNSAK